MTLISTQLSFSQFGKSTENESSHIAAVNSLIIFRAQKNHDKIKVMWIIRSLIFAQGIFISMDPSISGINSIPRSHFIMQYTVGLDCATPSRARSGGTASSQVPRTKSACYSGPLITASSYPTSPSSII